MEVLGTAGDSSLGGNDFDAALADWLLSECDARGIGVQAGGSSAGGSNSSDAADGSTAPAFRSRAEQQEWARRAAEVAKIALSEAEEAAVELPGGARLVLTRQRFEQLCAPLFQLMANVLEALGEALFVEWALRPSDAIPGQAAGSGSSSGDGGSGSEGGQQGQRRDKWAPPPRRITQVALVGQLTRLPSVRQYVQRITGGRRPYAPAAWQPVTCLGMHGLAWCDGGWPAESPCTGDSPAAVPTCAHGCTRLVGEALFLLMHVLAQPHGSLPSCKARQVWAVTLASRRRGAADER